MEIMKDNERFSATEEWQKAADSILDQTNLPPEWESMLIETFAGSHLGVPLLHPEHGYGVNREPLDVEKPNIVTVGFIDDDPDELIEGFMEQRGDLRQTARYWERYVSIFIDTRAPFTETWKGLVYIHEALHAGWHRKGEFRDDENLGHWREEALALELEINLACQINKGFKRLITKTAKNLLKTAAITEDEIAGIRIPEDSDASLDKLFGPALSKEEYDIRRSVFYVAVVFAVFKKVFPETYETERARYLKLTSTFGE